MQTLQVTLNTVPAITWVLLRQCEDSDPEPSERGAREGTNPSSERGAREGSGEFVRG